MREFNMYKSITFGILASLATAFSMQASADLVLNGVTYVRYSGTGTKCPDGSSVLRYNRSSWCKAYKAKVGWTIPTTRANGKALPISELKGYQVYWTRESDKSTGTINVNKSTAISTVMNTAVPGTYYFAISAIDTAGLKSTLSPVVTARLGR
jgi:hypothetical protein